MESDINPGIWEVLNNTNYGYGLVQWTPAIVFLDRAVSTGVISSATADSINSITDNNPTALINAELACLIWCCESRGDFFMPISGGSMDHTGYRMTFSEFKRSTLDAGTLAIVFHDHYERSGDGISGLNARSASAESWYSTFRLISYHNEEGSKIRAFFFAVIGICFVNMHEQTILIALQYFSWYIRAKQRHPC